MSYQEENAKSEMIAGAITTIGCFLPMVLIVAFLLIGGLIMSFGD